MRCNAGEGPEQCAQVNLGALLRDIETGKSPAAEDTPAGDGEWGVLKVSAIQIGSFIPEENKVVRDSSLIFPAYEVKDGDLLMTRANTEDLVGFACIARNPPPRLMLSDKTLRLVVNESVADASFLSLVLAQSSTRRQIWGAATGTSGSMKNISQSQIRQLRVPDLPLEEQRGIVAAHAVMERRIAALERVRTKLKTAETALVSAQLAETLKRVQLSSWLHRIEAGKSPLAQDTPAGDGQWGVLKVSAVQGDGFLDRENKVVRDAEFINPQFEVRAGDLLMTRANTEDLVGLACVVENPRPRLMLSDKTLRLMVDDSVVDAGFVAAVLSNPVVRSQIKSAATGTSGSMKNISQSSIERLSVPDVPLEQQKRVRTALAVCRRRVDFTQRQIVKLRAIQRGLLEDLISGKVSVPPVKGFAPAAG